MRPHVECIQEADLCWHEAELPRGEGKAKQRNLSYDEEDGSASTRVIFESAWSRPGGYHHGDIEWYIMEGMIKIGEQLLGKGGYFRAPAGLRPAAEWRTHHRVLPECDGERDRPRTFTKATRNDS